MSDDAAEKVQEASPQKKKRARQKGDTPVSTEVTAAAAFAGLLVAILLSAPVVAELATELKLFFMRPEEAARGTLFGDLGGRAISAAVGFVLPLVAFPAAASLVAIGVQGGIVFAPNKITPKIDKISPIKGAGKKFGPQGLFEFARSSLKASSLAAAGGVYLMFEAQRLARAFDHGPHALAGLLLREALVIIAISTALSIVFALIDVPFTRARYEGRLKMSRQEMQDENKENEGDQNIKAQRRRQAERIALSSMLTDIEKADVVIVNPTHYAVALKWERDGTNLPLCVAKGTDDVAFRLRERAHAAGVPIREDAPTARSLYATVQLGEPIRPDHFAVVAAAIRFADRARASRLS